MQDKPTDVNVFALRYKQYMNKIGKETPFSEETIKFRRHIVGKFW